MLTSLIRNWWAVGLVGALGLAFGVMAFAWPGMTLGALLLGFGAYALLVGMCLVAAGLAGEAIGPVSSRAWIVTTGILGISTGLITLLWPGITAVTLYAVIATWAILAGIAQTIAAVVHRGNRQHTWPLALGGVAMAIFGLYLLASPAALLALAFALGTYATLYGILMLAAAVPLKQENDRVQVTVTRMEHSSERQEENRPRR